MKKYIAICMMFGCLLSACNESEFLKETPKDFMSKDNSFVTVSDFDMAVNDLYNKVRLEFYASEENRPFDYVYGTDLIYDGEPGDIHRHSNMTAAYDPSSVIPEAHWKSLYKIIASANTIYDEVATKSFSSETILMIQAKALFFRGLAYRTLAYLYGGIPIITKETTTPKTDFVRATKEATLNQAIEDVKFAATTLKDITDVKDGEISWPAAYHLLAELYLATGQNEEAVKAATRVIDNPALELMHDRFGSRKDEAGKDVYWDLYRENNQNRSAGNTEGIWVIQFETDIPGGGSSTLGNNREGNYCGERHFSPMTRDAKLNGTQAFIWPASDYSGGRGVGWAVTTKHFNKEIWEGDFDTDMRNANHNFCRKIQVTKQDFKNKYPDIKEIDMDNLPAGMSISSTARPEIPRYLYPYQTKMTGLGDHPAALFANVATGELKGAAGATYTDQYMFRLAETYLLRAEAYLALGEKSKAADDINEVRAKRAHATPVSADKVTLDYILDERMRELGIEEKRRLTLMRTGTLYDRVMKYNPYYANPESNGDGVGMQKKYNLWPIPLSVIEANTDAVLEQNPGYEK